MEGIWRRCGDEELKKGKGGGKVGGGRSNDPFLACSVVRLSSSASQIMNFLASEDAYKHESTLFREGFVRLGSRQVHTVTEAP